jgi:hypothetical protein
MDLDLAVKKKDHPALWEEDEEGVDFVPQLPSESEVPPLEDNPGSDEYSTESEEDFYAKSS